MKKENRASRKKSEVSRIQHTNRKASSQKTGAVKNSQKSAGVNRSEGLQQYKLAGRPTRAQFVAVFGPNGPRMTWTQRAAAGTPAEKFQAALAAAMRK